MFAPAFPPFGNPEAIVNGKLALAFLDSGFEVEVVTRALHRESGYSYGSGWESPWFPLKGVVHEVEYEQTPGLRRALGTLSSGLRARHPIDGCRWAVHALQVARRLHRQRPFDVVISRSGPESAHLPALAFVRETGVPWIANWDDPWGVKHPSPYGGGRDARLGFWERRFMKEVVRHVSWHTFPSEKMREYICHYLGPGTSDKSSAIPHVARQGPIQKPSTATQTFTACHTGNLYRHRDPQKFLQAFALLCSQSTVELRPQLVLAGQSDYPIAEISEQLGIGSQVRVLPPQGYRASLDLAARSTVLVIIEAQSHEGIYLPAKLVDYAQTGRPILALTAPGSNVQELILRSNAGIAVDCGSVSEIEAGLRRLYSLWLDGTLQATLGSGGLADTFAPSRIVSKYTELFECLVASR